ncbi:MAG: glycoside hydrolase family 13 protein [Gemmatimonadaceae bacterium]|nr:glycoside hydrolase family 13 protein [Gemmatimonadaceae bacterium]
MPAPRLSLLLLWLSCTACSAGAVEQPSVTPPPPVPVDTLPIAFVHDPQNATHLSAANGALSIRFRSTPGRVTAAVVEANGLTGAMQPQFRYRGQDVWRGTLPVGVASYRIRVTTTKGDSTFGPFTVPTGVFQSVAWVGRSVGYQIFPERFWNGDPSNDALTLSTDEHVFMPQWAVPQLRPWRGAPVTDQLCCHEYFGGDLAGITQRLDSLRALGVTMLYLNPIFSSGSAHGYDTYDYLQVEPSFGTEATLRTLLDAAHARSMKVLFDFVPNHVGLGFPRFQDAVKNGPTSASWNWFTFTVPAAQIQIGNPAHYATFAGSGAMPKLNTANPEVLNYLMQVARTWMQFGFDGIRVDVPNELPNAAAFARALRETAKSVKSDAYVVGEIWDRAPSWVQGDQYDALMNYAVGQSIVEPFVKGIMSGSDAADNLGLVFMEYPEASTAMAFNVIATHDTPRLLTKLGAGPLGTTPASDVLARQQLATAMLFALPGVPLTFQGDECAFTGAMNENRYPVQWDQCSATMRAHYTQLAAVRANTPALTSPALRIASSSGNVIAWYRGEAGQGEVLAIFNAGLAPIAYPLPTGIWTNLITQQQSPPTPTIPQLSWLLLRRN